MKIYLILTMFLLLLIVTVCLFGCGGSDGTSVTILSTPTPNEPNTVAYLHIKIKWPQPASNGKDLIASIPSDTKRITIQVFDINENILTHIAVINYPDDETTIYFETIPAEKVIVKTEAYNSVDPIPLSTFEKEIKLKAGRNEIDLPLGDYDLTLTADPNRIVLGGSSVSGSSLISNLVSVPTPIPVTTGESKITATLSIKYPGDPNDPNSMPVYKPVPHKDIHFTLEGGGNLSYYDKETEEVTGSCTTTLTTTEPGPKTITATFQADPLDPNSIYTKTCEINVNGDPNLELYKLTLNWDPNSSNQFIIIPDFQSDDYSLIDNVTLIAKLMKLDPNTFQYDIPASKQITFTVTDNNITKTTTGKTNSDDGIYLFNVPYNGNITPRTINVQASFQPDPNDEAKTVTDTLPVEVKDNKLFSENFESYEVNTLVNNFPNWSGSVYGYENLNYIVSDGANGSNKSVQLYADINSTGVSRLQHYIGNSILLNPTEYRFYIKNGTETLGVPPVGLPSGGTRTRGVFSCCGYSWLISCIYNGNEINDHIGNHLGNYGQDWIPIRVQIIPQGPHLGHKVIYYISDVKTNEFIHNSIDETFKGIKLLTYGGRVWFDEIEVYSFVGLPSKSNPNLRK